MTYRKHNNSKQAVLDVCILEAGRFDMLSKCLDTLYREAQTTSLNIYILCNGCNQDEINSNKELLAYQPDKDPNHGVIDFRVKYSQINLGFPTGNGELVRLGKSPLIMFLNDDVELQAGAIEQIVKDFNDQTVGIVGIKLLFPADSTRQGYPAGKVQHCGMCVDIRGNVIHPLIGWSADNPKTSISRDVWAVTGACYTTRRQVYNKLGGFDRIYGLGTFEDIDYCMKIRQAGLRVYFDAKSQGYHYTNASVEKLKVGFPIQQNRSIFMSRWQNSGQIWWNENEYW
jgi:GT2 family glycosyltransferase